MTFEIIKQNITDYCSSICDASLAQKVEGESEPYYSSALSAIHELTDRLEKGDITCIETFYELDNKILELELHNPKTSNQTVKSHSQGVHALIHEVVLSEFLNMSTQEQEKTLLNPKMEKAIHESIKSANQNKVMNEGNGDLLLHQLCRSDSTVVRQLALNCIESGLEVNTPNKNGGTALHFAALNNDTFLINALMNLGADPLLKTYESQLSSLDLTIKGGHFSSTIEMCLHQPTARVNGVPVVLDIISSTKINNPETVHLRLKLIEILSKTSDFEEHIDSLWIAVQGCIDSSNFEASWGSPERVAKQNSLNEKVIHEMLDKTPASHTCSVAQVQLLQQLANQMDERNFSGPQDFQLVKALSSHHLLPLLRINNVSLLAKVMENAHFSESQKNEITEQIDNQSLMVINALFSAIHEFKEAEFIQRLKLVNQIRENLDFLKENKFPQFDLILTGITPLTKDFNDQIEAIQEMQKKVQNGTATSGILTADFYAYLVFKKDWELISQAWLVTSDFSHEQGVNKLLFHFMMDKLLPTKLEDYIGLSSIITAHAIIHALQNTMSARDPETYPILEKLTKTLEPAIEDFVYLAYMDTDVLWCTDHIIENIEKLEVGKSLLIPTGCHKHATSLLITKTDLDKFTLTQYNTGQGTLTWHNRWEDTNRYQTFYAIDNVPLSSLLKKEGWQNLLMNRKIADDMDPSYIIIRNVLGKGGKIRPPSPHSEDYEAKQVSGTCGLQCLMALLRHLVMQLATGTPEEKEGLYKLLKSQMFIRYYQDNLSSVDAYIQTQIPTIINKHKAELKMAELSKDPQQFEETMAVIEDMFIQLSHEDLAIKMRESAAAANTTMARYAALRNSSIVLSNLWFENKQFPVLDAQQAKFLELALAKYEKLHIIHSNMSVRLQEAEENLPKLVFELFRMISATPYVDLAIKETIKYFGDELPDDNKPPEGMKTLLSSLNKYPIQNGPKVLTLAKKLEESGKVPLADWTRKYWEQLNASSQNTGKQFD